MPRLENTQVVTGGWRALGPLEDGEQFEYATIAMHAIVRRTNETLAHQSPHPFIGQMVRDRSNYLTILGDSARLNAAKVEQSTAAIKLLAKLYQTRVITKEEFEIDCDWLQSIALARLSSALLCEVDEFAIRLTDHGANYVEDLLPMVDE